MKKNTVTKEHVDGILENSFIDTFTSFGKCTIVTCQLPNGFIIVESSACVDPTNYDEDMGRKICLGRIEDKIWELEGYKLQSELKL
jgi:Phage protein (N4 Gp49/phage Sf6 gene 66) family